MWNFNSDAPGWHLPPEGCRGERVAIWARLGLFLFSSKGRGTDVRDAPDADPTIFKGKEGGSTQGGILRLVSARDGPVFDSMQRPNPCLLIQKVRDSLFPAERLGEGKELKGHYTRTRRTAEGPERVSRVGMITLEGEGD